MRSLSWIVADTFVQFMLISFKLLVNWIIVADTFVQFMLISFKLLVNWMRSIVADTFVQFITKGEPPNTYISLILLKNPWSLKSLLK